MQQALFARAWQQARAEDLDLLKSTGIAAELGALLESQSRFSDALYVYNAALEDIRKAQARPSELARGILFARKIASIPSTQADKAEEVMEWAVAELIKLSASPEQLATAQERAAKGEDGMAAGDIVTPRWLRNESLDLSACLEQLGAIYLARGKHELAVPAYLQTLSILGRVQQPTTEHRCRTALVMSQLSAALASDSKRLDQAIRWARQSIDVADSTVAEMRDGASECVRCAATGLVNLGALLAMSGRRAEARKTYEQAIDRCSRISFAAGVERAQDGLSKLS